ncbi:MAG TPA: sigma-70 family RNA polymerase sigma factor [Opitutaceae bacterium]|nr:sigma-70 family RNA polymerase sigma factor [Opitutaceae bacterium]
MDHAEPLPLSYASLEGWRAPAGDRTEATAPVFGPEALAVHRELVARMAAGDAAALRTFVDEMGGRVHGVVLRILRDPEATREAVQDTFLKAWRQAGSYRPARGEVISWLVFIARNVAIDRVRRQARQRALLETLRDEADGVVPAPQDDFVRREAVTLGLARLAAPQRRALELAFFDGCTQAEIAAAMRTPVGNVKNHLARGLRKLRELFPAHE